MNSDYGNQHSSGELPPYLSLYHLHEMPFTANAQGHYYYESNDLAQQLNLILHLLQSTRLILTVIGSTGIGKSSLLGRLRSRAPENLRPFIIDASATRDADGLLKNLAHRFNLPTDCGKVALMHLLDEEARKLGQQDSSPVLLVDDAHLLHTSAIDLLFQLAQGTGEHKIPWHMVLFAESDLSACLANSGIRMEEDARIHVIELSPLTEPQTAGYLQLRMTAAGLTGSLPLKPEEITRIYKSSQGVPAEINHAAHLLLMEHAAGAPSSPAENAEPDLDIPATPMLQEEIPEILAQDMAEAVTEKRRLPWKGFLLGMTAISLLAAGLLLEDKINALFSPSVDQHEITTLTPAPLPPVAATAPRIDPAMDVDTTMDATRLAIDDTPPQQERDFMEQAKSGVADLDAIPTPDLLPAPEQPETGITPPPAPQQTVTEPAPTPAPDLSARSDSPAMEPPQVTTPRPLPTAKASAATSAGPIHDGAWLLAQAPTAFTVQLLASREHKSILALLKSNQLDERQAAVYQAQRNHQQLHILLYGIYPDAEDAKRAIAQLPAAVRKLRPWRRPLTRVQEEIRGSLQ